MRIAINTRFLLDGKMEGFGWFTYETVKRMVLNHPEHEFIFFFDRPYNEKFVFADNVTPVVLKPQARHPILFKIWFNRSVTKALKKYKADIFFSPDGYLSLKTDVPQIGVIHDLNFEHHPEDIPKRFRPYLKKHFPLFAKKAKHIVTVSEYSKQDIVKTYGVSADKITVAHNGGAELYKPLDESIKQSVKDKYAYGEDYFIYVGALHARKNVQRMIEGFQKFSSESGSNTRMIIVGENLFRGTSNEVNDPKIQFTGHLDIENLTRLVGASKALVLVSYFEGFGIPLVEAMRCGVPVISGNLTSLPEVTGDAGLLVDPYSVDEIAEAFKRMDSEDQLQRELAQKALERSTQFSWDKSAEIIWSVIENHLR